jgi:hypothetical protein
MYRLPRGKRTRYSGKIPVYVFFFNIGFPVIGYDLLIVVAEILCLFVVMLVKSNLK